MYVVDVLPLAKGVRAESLSYFSPEKVSRGTIVTIPIQSRTESGIAVSCTPAQEMKATLKEAPYEMKQLADAGKQVFFSQYITACEAFARFSGVTAGATIRALTPTPIIKSNEKLPGITSDIFLPDITAPTPKIIQATNDKQVGYINSLIQSRIANGESVFICTPTAHSISALKQVIETTATVIKLQSGIATNELISRWREIATGNKPVVVIATAPFLSVPRTDLGLIIVMDEMNEAYKMIERPFLDKAKFARHLARSFKRDSILTGNVLPVETIWEYRNNELRSAFKPTFRYESAADCEVINMRELKKGSVSGVKLFSPPTAKEIRKVVSQSRKLLLFVARRGHRPFTICNDCGETVKCERCGYPLVLIEENGERRYICRTCKNEQTSLRRCDNCHSWRLEALGVGIDFVAEVLRDNLPELPVFQIDGGNISNEKKLESVMNEFKAADSGVLLTTQLGVNRLDHKVDASAVITADSLLAVPDLSAAEKLFSLLLTIREASKESFLIQTRSNHTEIFQQVADGDVTNFYRDQIEEREQFKYPPFSYLIKLTASGKIATVKKNMKHVRKLFGEETITMYPSSGGRGYTAHALLKIKRDRWPDEELIAKLRSLPLAIAVNAHPRSLL